ncbi:MAG: ATP-binding cassette domain-containing protein [Lentisphaeria bacterium]|nr:ATP-binding cassette domain-containing protein [Lentisphaeria bacterium]
MESSHITEQTSQPSKDAITARNLSKTFPYPSPGEYFRYIFHLPPAKPRTTVLKDLTFSVKRGRMLGVLGRNGAGKSTLLRVIAGLHDADGELKVRGNVAAIFEMGLSSNMFLTGREYCRRYFQLVGKPASMLTGLEEDVKEFSELKEFFDEKINTYSSGMQARLFFGILMIQGNVDIYLLDEILSVGDVLFQKKSYKKLISILNRHQASGVFVTHDWMTAMKICDDIMILNRGNVEFYGPSETAVQLFLKDSPTVQNDEGKGCFPEKAELLARPMIYRSGELWQVSFLCELKQDLELGCTLSIDMPRQGAVLFISRSDKLAEGKGTYRVTFTLPKMPAAGRCYLTLGMCEPFHPGEASTRSIYDALSWVTRNGIKLEDADDSPKPLLPIKAMWRRLS